MQTIKDQRNFILNFIVPAKFFNLLTHFLCIKTSDRHGSEWSKGTAISESS